MQGLRGSVIIATWNTRDLLADCLDSIREQDLPGGLETIVVDNASTDGTAELLAERAAAGEVRVIANARNAGFAEANNQGAAAARGRILFLLNSDTRLTAPDTLARLADAAEAPGVGVAGPMLLNPDGSLQASCAAHPSPGRALLVGAGLHRLVPDRLRPRLSPDTWSHSAAADVDWLKGAALAIPAGEFQAVGGLWPTMYGEEQDLALKLRRRGLRVRFEPAARVVHVGNQTASKRWSDAGRARRVAHAELLFLRTHYPRPRAAAIRSITGTAYAARALAHTLLRHRGQAAVYRALARTYAAGGGEP
ncbi:MAG TPA: glycosyltransferase family 2 protein [Thermoleophilaceae bacterium]